MSQLLALFNFRLTFIVRPWEFLFVSPKINQPRGDTTQSLWYITMNLHERFDFNAFCRVVSFFIYEHRASYTRRFALTSHNRQANGVLCDDDDDKWQVLSPTVQYSSRYFCHSRLFKWSVKFFSSLWCWMQRNFSIAQHREQRKKRHFLCFSWHEKIIG